MNTSQDSGRQVRRVTAALAATALAGAALAVPSAANARQTSEGGGRCVSCAPRTALPHRAAFTFVIDDFVAERKAKMAQDWIDRAWLHG